MERQLEALRINLKAAAARIAKQEQTFEVFKQQLADLKVKAAKKGQSHQKNAENE